MTPRETREQARPEAPHVFRFDEYRLDSRQRLLYENGSEVELAPRAFNVLEHLASRAGEVVSRDDLLALWDGTEVTEHSISEAIALIRQALGDSAAQPRYIETLRKRGYRFKAQVVADGVTGTVSTDHATIPRPGVDQADSIDGFARLFRSRSTMAALAILALGAAAAAFVFNRDGSSSTSPGGFLALNLAAHQPLDLGSSTNMALSPDGQWLAYYGRTRPDQEASLRLVLRRLSDHEGIEVPAGGYAPFFSPDSSQLGFMTGRRLYTVPVAGGERFQVCTFDGIPRGASWGDDGNIIFTPGRFSGLWIVPATGGDARPLTTVEDGVVAHFWPQVLPGSDVVLFTAFRGGVDNSRVVALHRPTGRIHTLIEGGGHGRYVSSGHLFFSRGGQLYAIRFDPETLLTSGEPRVVLRTVDIFPGISLARYDVTLDGVLVTTAGSNTPIPLRTRMRWYRPDGSSDELPFDAQHFRRTQMSPDGSRVAVELLNDSFEIWVYDLHGRDPPGSPAPGVMGQAPVWMPDGQRIAFAAPGQAGSMDIFTVPYDGSEVPQVLIRRPRNQWPDAFTAEGHLIYTEDHEDTGADLWVADLADPENPRPLLRTPHGETKATVSPDGRWFAYEVWQSNPARVEVRSFPEPGEATLISGEHRAGSPQWSADGRHIFYREYRGPTVRTAWVMSVPLAFDRGLTVGPPSLLFDAEIRGGYRVGHSYDFDPVSGRFLTVTRPPEQAYRTTTKLSYSPDIRSLLPR